MTTHYERGTTFSGPLCLVVPVRENYPRVLRPALRPGQRSGQPGAERGGLDPVLARGRAVPAGAVARGVHVDPVAPGGRADAEPVVQLTAEHHGEAGAAARGPAVRQGAVGGVEVQVPRLPVVPFELRPGAGADEQRVD